jgi:hypothetical protein
VIKITKISGVSQISGVVDNSLNPVDNPIHMRAACRFVKPTRRYLFIHFLILLNNPRAPLIQSQTLRDRNTLEFRRV